MHKTEGAYRNQKTGALRSASLRFFRAASHPDVRQDRMAAIIIDDLGHDLEMAEKFLALKLPLTYSVLPYRHYSEALSKKICERGGEVLLHVPLEPRDYPEVNPGAGCLLTSMGREAIQSEINDQIDSLPCCAGVSSYMGSSFTESVAPMTWMLAVIRERGLFFVDSLTTPESVAGRVATARRLPWAQRSHFLDEQRTVDYVVRQLCALADSALQNGWALGIGHPFEETLQALPRGMAALAEKGIRLVPVSELTLQERLPQRESSVLSAGKGDGSDHPAAPKRQPS
ncbi:MAG: divergent polysaccharide deacetylase family protein [bacterium]